MRTGTHWRLDLRRWVKSREHPVADACYRIYHWFRTAAVPPIPAIHRPLYILHRGLAGGIEALLRIFWYTPLFQSCLEKRAERLWLYNGIPHIEGTVSIVIGADCRIAGRLQIVGRTTGPQVPRLVVGNNVDLGWDSHLAVGRRIEIGNNVRISSNVRLIGYPGHPIDPLARARGEPDTEDQVGDIVIEDDVWLAAGVVVNRGVRIGRGTIVAMGSVVTHDLPPFCLAAGVPARLVKSLPVPPATDRAS